MKKLLAIVILGLLFIVNANAENIFDCETKEGKLVVKVDDNFDARLITGDPDTGIFRQGDLIMSDPGAIGEVIITSRLGSTAKGSYKLFVTNNTKKGDHNYFKGISDPRRSQHLLSLLFRTSFHHDDLSIKSI